MEIRNKIEYVKKIKDIMCARRCIPYTVTRTFIIRHDRHNQPVAILVHAYLAGCSSLTGFAVIHRCQAGQIEGRGTMKYA